MELSSTFNADVDCTTILLMKTPSSLLGGVLLPVTDQMDQKSCHNYLPKRLFLGRIQIVRNGSMRGALAQLARAPALQAGGPGFESLMLHQVLLPNTFGGRTWCGKHHAHYGLVAQLVRARH